MKNINTLSAAFITTYPPRKCGIGTYTNDLVQSLMHLSGTGADRRDHLQVIAMNDIAEGYDYPGEVNFVIREQYKGDYREAAEFLNLSSVDVISLQHEYGIFGGTDGNHILYLLDNLKKPVVSTLHTVLNEPSAEQKETLKTIVSLSTVVVVLAKKAIEILERVYHISKENVMMIPHGAPDVPFLDTSYYKDNFQAENRRVLLTFGLLNPNKGIEYVLDALSVIVKDFPDVLYFVLGATHPNVKRNDGEKYRIFLERRVEEYGLQDHVVFHNRFVSLERLIQFLVATDIYITPYLTKEQISSGTLSYALTCGKASISTPYWYAEELLQENRGILVPFKDSKALTQKIGELLSNKSLCNQLRKSAYQFGRQMIWKEVAYQYDVVFEKAVTECGRKKIIKQKPHESISQPVLPEIKLDHLKLLTDDTGILQHAFYHTPNRCDGYSTDDNARALMVTAMHYEMFQEDDKLILLHRYLAFINQAMNPSIQRFHNFMSYGREWLDEMGSEDSHGRVIWSLGYTIWTTPSDAVLSLANQLFKQGLKSCLQFSSPRAWSYAILGSLYYLARFGGDTETKGIVTDLGERLLKLYLNNCNEDWLWFENIVTYANARMPQALIATGKYLDDKQMIRHGLESLDWIIKVQTSPDNQHFSLVGNNGWYRKGGVKPQYDQQPLEILSIMEACAQALQVVNENQWRKELNRAFAWFLGKNDIHEYICDFRTGGCYDGIQRGGVNMNQGAESTLTWLAALHLMYRMVYKDMIPTQIIQSEKVIDESSGT
ncbi:glycosyltransferase family 4 protein [bacterium]|nr:glycosyltransferase family 4 protein [bacterium]